MADRFSKLRTPSPRATPSPILTDRFNHLRIISPAPSPVPTDRFDALRISTTPVPPEATDRFSSLQTPQTPMETTDRFAKPTPISMPEAEESPGGGRFSHLQKTDNRDNNNFKKRERRDPIMSGAAMRIMPKKLIVDENTNEWEIAAARRNGIEIEEKLNMESETQFPDLATAIAVAPNIKKMKPNKKPQELLKAKAKAKPRSDSGGGAGEDTQTKEDDDDDFLTNGGKINKSKQKKPSFAQLAKEMAERAEQERLEIQERKTAEEEERRKRQFGTIFMPIATRQGTYNSLVDELDDDIEEHDTEFMPGNEDEEENGYY